MKASVSIYDPEQTPILHLTPAAIDHLKKQVVKAKALGWRLSAKKAGCSGWKYDISFVFTPIEQDEKIVFDELLVYIDKKHLDLLRGLCVDYVKEGLNGSLQFNNPNQKVSCGCGESFGV